MPRALTALLLGLALAGPGVALGPGVAEPEWTIGEPAAVPEGAPFEVTFRAVLPEGYYQDAASSFLIVEPEAGSGLVVVGRRTSAPAERLGKASFTGRFEVVLRLQAPAGPTPTEGWSFRVGWQICRENGVCLLPATRTLTAAPPARLPTAPDQGWAAMLAGAFLGGLLLNLMPCVFPVLALKGLALARASEVAGRTRRRKALASAAGTFAAFAGLGLVTAAAAALGQRLDWGFTFQSPGFVAALALVFWAFALQLAGVWTGPGLVAGRPGKLTGGGLGRAFAGGAFVVVAAAPCTAPFLGPAVGWAFGQPPPVVAAAFAAAGAGLALPGLLLVAVPGLAGRLPKPGVWLRWVERVAALLMALTALGLVAVVAQQRGPAVWGWGAAAGALVGVGLGLSGRNRAAGFLLASAAALATVGASAAAPAPKTEQAAPLPRGWMAYSPGSLEDARAAGRTVLIDATAAWCLTCQVNEAAVLLRPDVAKLLARKGVVLLRADFTLPSDSIAVWLASVGRAGLPVYALYVPGRPLVLFPELLTDDNFTRVIAALP